MLEVIELYKNFSKQPPEPKKKPVQPKHSRPSRSRKLAIPRKSWTQRVTGAILWTSAFFLLTIASVTVGGIVALLDRNPLSIALQQHSSGVETAERLDRYPLSRPVNLLVMGIGGDRETPDAAHLLAIAHFDPIADSVKFLSIPSITRVDIPNRGKDAIAKANSIGGISLTLQAIAPTLNSLAIDRYLRLNPTTFRDLINAIGGVEIFVPNAMTYTDPTTSVLIPLEPGWQTLNGQQALAFLYFREQTDGEKAQIQRQQLLLIALHDRIASPTLLPELPRIVRLMHQSVETNLTLEESLALVNLLRRRSPNAFQTILLPGSFKTLRRSKTSYWNIDPKKRDRILHDYFDFESTPTHSRDRRPSNPSPQTLKIAIQNASGNPLAIGQMLSNLKALGFKNVYAIADWPQELSETQIIVQQGDLASAMALQNLLTVGAIEANSIGDLDSDLTIRIGQDWIRDRESDLVE